MDGNRTTASEAAAFTVHGTVGHEFAYMGVPVVNAGDNLHIAFDFNINPETVEEYTRCIANAAHLDHPVDRQQVEEFYYMHNFYFQEKNRTEVDPIDAAWRNAPDFFKKSRKPETLTYFLETETPEKQRKISEYLDSFFSRDGKTISHV